MRVQRRRSHTVGFEARGLDGALPEAVEDHGPATSSVAELLVPTRLAPNARRRPRREPGSFLLTIAVGAAGLGLLVAAFVVYLFGFTTLEAFHAQHRLAEELGGAAGLTALNGRAPAVGEPVAILQIPSLRLRQIVVEGTSSEDLESGPGLLAGSAPPGTNGDVVIAGRRTTFGAPFAGLDTLRQGDEVSVTAALGQFEYRVAALRTVSPGSPLPASPTSSGRLTLVTSAHAFGASSLLVVTADLVGKPVATVPLSAAAMPSADFGLAGDAAAAVPTIAWGLALLAVLVVAWYLKRRSGRTWLVYGLSTPVVVAVALVCFANAAALLPATL